MTTVQFCIMAKMLVKSEMGSKGTVSGCLFPSRKDDCCLVRFARENGETTLCFIQKKTGGKLTLLPISTTSSPIYIDSFTVEGNTVQIKHCTISPQDGRVAKETTICKV